LRHAVAEQRAQQAARTAASRVNFFTLQPETAA
jgi:alpha-D-ribose 1-methylphosphonate 5-triphosphate synthase subunit PhnG